MNTITQAQRFAATYAAQLARRQLRTISIVSAVTKIITAGVAVISYRHQSSTLLGWEAPAEIAYGLPGLVDLLTIVCVLALSTPALIPAARRVAGRVIVVPVLTSAAINFAGHGSIGVKLAALSLPVFIPLGELVGSVIKPDFAEMDRIERAAYAVATPAPIAAPVDEEAVARRKAAAAKGAETRARNKAEADAKAEAKRAARRVAAAAKRLEEVAPSSPGHPLVILSAADREALAHLDARARR